MNYVGIHLQKRLLKKQGLFRLINLRVKLNYSKNPMVIILFMIKVLNGV